jgi:hypothetical protein
VIDFLPDLPRGRVHGRAHALLLGVAQRAEPAVLQHSQHRQRDEHRRHQEHQTDRGPPHVKPGESSIRIRRKPSEPLRFYVSYKRLSAL